MQLSDSSIMYIVTGRESSIKYMRHVVYFWIHIQTTADYWGDWISTRNTIHRPVKPADQTYNLSTTQAHRLLIIELHMLDNGPRVRLHGEHVHTYMSSPYDLNEYYGISTIFWIDSNINI